MAHDSGTGGAPLTAAIEDEAGGDFDAEDGFDPSASSEPHLDATPVQPSGRGRLKIFFGAAPGVGKTYAMLGAAQVRRREGVDVVVAVAETHGRVETEALLAGLESIPLKRVDYRGQQLEEMDLDAVLRRRPKLALVDELAHTNVIGSRHPRRHLDVEELLKAGIDVYTTLNVQHLESLNDVVARITRVKVRETLPDSVLEKAEEIELVDVTPDALLERLREGKIHVPEHARREMRHFFAPGNLTALRELALRRTAERVDNDMVGFMRANNIEGPWPAGERVLVCVDANPNAARLVRAGRRIADRLRAKWTAIYIEGRRHRRLTDAERDRVAETLRLTERLGGEVKVLPGDDMLETLLHFARSNNVSHIVIGRTRRSRAHELLRGSIVQALMRRAGAIDVYVLSTEEREGRKPARSDGAGWLGRLKRPKPLPYLIAGASVVAVTLLAHALGGATSRSNLTIMYLAAVLASALTAGLGPALVAGVAGLLAHNFFFVYPLHRLTFGDYNDIVSLIMFLAVAVLTSNLMARVREQAEDALRREAATGALYAFSRKLAGVGAVDDLLWAIVHQIAAMLRARVVLLLPDRGRLVIRAGYPPDDELGEADWAAARWAWDQNEPAGRGSDNIPTADRTFLPLRTARGTVGVFGIDRALGQAALSPDERRLLEALADQAAMAIERLDLAEDMDEERVRAATERLRANLLGSISHDLRSPLTAIIGAASALDDPNAEFGEASRRELISALLEESGRLARFVGNLLDMNRLEAGGLQPRPTEVEIDDVVGAALARVEPILGPRRVRLDIEPALPVARLDFPLFEQVLANLLDNAAKYSPPEGVIRLHAFSGPEGVVIEVIDNGFGIPAEDLAHVFDKFYRVDGQDRGRVGTGLGLAICRGFVEAMGGRIEARSGGIGFGSTFRVTLPPDLLVSLAPPSPGEARA